MGAFLDDCSDADGRWVAVVRAWGDASHRGWAAAVFSNRGGWIGRGAGNFHVQSAEEAEPKTEAVPNRAALLVEGLASGSILLSIGAYHDGVFSGARGELLLPFAGVAAVLFGDQHRRFAHRAGNALLERRARRNGARRGARLRIDHAVCVSRLGVAALGHGKQDCRRCRGG